MLPEGKAELVGSLQAAGHTVAMVGDGINDAPALMRADVGPLGSGADIATESADINIVRDDLNLLLTARDISSRSYRRVKQNVGVAFTFNGIGIPLEATGLVYPVWAMAAMAASVTAIFINSIGGRPRLLFAAIASVGRTAQPDQPAAGPDNTAPRTTGTTGGNRVSTEQRIRALNRPGLRAWSDPTEGWTHASTEEVSERVA